LSGFLLLYGTTTISGRSNDGPSFLLCSYHNTVDPKPLLKNAAFWMVRKKSLSKSERKFGPKRSLNKFAHASMRSFRESCISCPGKKLLRVVA
jgi:hypothetical protein